MALSRGAGESRVPLPRRAGSRRASRRRPPIASAIWNSRRGCRSSSGAAFPTTSCSTLAERGQAAHSPRCSNEQVRRMLADPRSRALVTNFAGQWLYLRNLASITPDMRLFPDFDDNLRQAFRAGDGAVLREHPARGSQRARSAAAPTTRSSTNGWRSTTASRTSTAAASAASRSTSDSGRGGLLRQGSILTVTSYATRTSPVHSRQVDPREHPRGAAAAAAARRAGAEGQHGRSATLSVRERLAEHRDQSRLRRLSQADGSRSASSLENFDAVGRWRDGRGGRADRRDRGPSRRQHSSRASTGSSRRC